MRCIRFVVFAILIALTVPAFASDEPLPRVLIVGDAVYHQHARGVSKDLKDRAQVVVASWPRDAVPHSGNALVFFDQLLGFADANGDALPEGKRPAWDLIHVNVGLGDLIHRVPNMESFRVLPIDAGGVVTNGPKRYEANLDALMKRLKATGAEIIWASTTPIRHSRSNVFELGSEIRYNAIAAKVMARHAIPTNDMYRYTKSLMNMDKPAGHGADPFNFDKKPIHMPIVRVVERSFGLEPMPETEEEKAYKEAVKQPAPTQG